MKTKRLITLTIITVLMALSAAVPFALVHASGGPVGMESAATRPGRQDPTCDDTPKVGSVLMNPGGTQNAMEQIVFNVPFCTSDLAAFATVNNHNTAGESVGAMPWGVEAVNLSMQLDEVSTAVYTVFWRVEPITE